MPAFHRVVSVMLVLPALAAAQSSLPLKHQPRPTTPEITAGDLMTRLYIYADDSMQGRETGTAGDVKATDYIAAEARRLGLKPAGDSGGYFQTLPLKTRTFDTTSTIAVNGSPLEAYADYIPVGRQAASTGAITAVYGGVVTDSTHWVGADQAAGRLVVFNVVGGFSSLRSLRRVPNVAGAAAVALIGLDGMPSLFLTALRRPQTYLDDGAAPPPGPAAVLLTSAAAAKMFRAPLESLTVGTAGATVTIDMRFQITPARFPARNVVAIVPGSDAKLKGEYVAIGAHNDHIGMTPQPVDHDSIRIWNHVVRPEGADDAFRQGSASQQLEVDSLLAAFRATHPGSTRADSIDNGADDDGSGTVTVLEIAERIATLARKPRRSILFVWHTGEEKGLLGSRFFTDHPTVPRDSIVAQLNMDMVGRGDAADETGRTKEGTPLHGSPGYLQLVGSRRLSTELGDLIEQVNKADHHDLTFDYAIDADGHPSNIYCRSDHYEYARYGIPITFFTTGLHSDYHQVTDEPQYIDYEHMAKVGNLVEDVAIHVADLDHRPVVDHPKPDPTAPCRQ